MVTDEKASRLLLRAEILYGGKTIVAHTLEVSEIGAFIQTSVLIAVGEALRVRLSLRGLVEPLELEGKVSSQRLAVNPGDPRGIFVAFLYRVGEERLGVGALLRRALAQGTPVPSGPRPYRVLVVDAPEELQIDRVRRRSGLAHDEVRAIVAAQASRARRLAAADDVIENRGTIEELREQVAALHRKYLEYSKAAQ